MGLSGITSLIILPKYFGETVKPLPVHWSITDITAIGDRYQNICVSIGDVLSIPTFHLLLVTLTHTTCFKMPTVENYPRGVVNLLLLLQIQNIWPNHLSPNLWSLDRSAFSNSRMIDTLPTCFQSVSFLVVIHFGSIKTLPIQYFVSSSPIQTGLGSNPNPPANPPSRHPSPHTRHNLLFSSVGNVTCTTAVYL